MAALITGLARLPLRLVRGPVGVVLMVLRLRRSRHFDLPVAGLDENKAQPLWFALRRAARTREEQAVADRWLEALQVCQVASSLLLGELDEMQANLRYWHRQEQHAGHFWNPLLRRGPLHFLGQLAVLLRIARRPDNLLPEADLVEKRVLIFRLLRSAVAEALAQVQAAAALLYLQDPAAAGGGAGAPGAPSAAVPGGAAGGVGHAASAGEIAAAGEGEEGLFQRADRLVTASLAAVAQAFAQLDAAAHSVLDAQQGPAAAPVDDQQVLQGALSRVLGLHHLRRIFSRLVLLPDQPAAAAAALPPRPPAAAAAAAPANGVQALGRARRAVGLCQLLPASCSVHTALESARRMSRGLRGRRLIEVPRWARMPSEVQQHWVYYSLIGAASGYGALFLYRHSRLSGSRDLEEWLRAGAEAVQGAWREHVVAPLAGLRNELFNTFRARPTITSMDDYEQDRDSLQRMLDDFRRDFIRKRGAAAAEGPAQPQPPAVSGVVDLVPAVPGGAAVGADSTDERQLLEGMDLVMRTYEAEMQKPLRNLVAGELVRALLIQVQKLKVDTASAMLEMDQILKANELSISLLAAVPAFLIAGGAVYYAGRLVTPTPPDPRREALPVRLAMVEVERALEHVARVEEAAAAAAPGAEPTEAEAAEQQGMFAYRLAVAYEAARELFRRHRGLIALGGSEWPSIKKDLLELASPGAAPGRRRTAERMMRTYTVFQSRM